MNERYNHIEIEKKWQNYWEEHDSFKTVEDETKKKYYVLEMFLWVFRSEISNL